MRTYAGAGTEREQRLGGVSAQLLTAMPMAFALDTLSLHLHDAECTIRHQDLSTT